MATANIRRILQIPGRLCYAPTDLSTAFPHGGTALGLTRDAEFRPNIRTSFILAEEFGMVPVDAMFTGEAAVFTAVLREWDNDALSTVLVNSAAGSSSNDRVWSGSLATGMNRPGYLLSNKAVKLLWSPKDTTNHPGILLYKAMPAVSQEAVFMLSSEEEAGMVVSFHAMPDSTGRLYQVGKLEDLTL